MRGELDYDVNLRAEAEIQTLSSKLNLLTEKIGDVDDLLREQLKLKRQGGACHRPRHSQDADAFCNGL